MRVFPLLLAPHSLLRPLTSDFRIGRPIATNAYVCPYAKHVRIVTEMHTLFPATIVFLVVFGLFLPPRHPPDSVPVVCTRLKKMQSTVCIKIGNLRSGIRSRPSALARPLSPSPVSLPPF